MKMMKKILFTVLLAGFLSACDTDVPQVEQSQMVVYIVDYDMNKFEAGTVLNFNKVNIVYDEMEVEIDLDEAEPGIDGAISLLYDPTGDKIFEGALNVEGNAEINFPGVTRGEDFYQIDDNISRPTTVQDIDGPYSENFSPIWGTIDNLGLTEIFINENPLVARFLYKPNNTNKQNWKWIILLLDQ